MMPVAQDCPDLQDSRIGKREGALLMFAHARRRAWRRPALSPRLEPLEGRELLSTLFTGPSATLPVRTTGGIFQIQVSGPGVVKVHPAGRSAIQLTAFGTTSATTITVGQLRPLWHSPSRLLVLNKVVVVSGQLGSFNATPSELNGSMTQINNTVNTLEFGEIGPNAQIKVNGDVGTMSANQVDLGPLGQVVISGALNTNDLTGSMTIGNLTVNSGRFVIGADSIAPISVTGDMTISKNGLFSVGRDMDGSLTVNGNLELDTGGQLFVGRNMSNLTVNGNIIVNPSGSGIVVNGALGSLSVTGIFQGQGGTSAPTLFDLGVGLTLDGLNIAGGTLSQNGLINANIRAGSTISGVNITYGTVNSTIQPNTPPPVT
jgi:hypothetical protein